MTNINKSNKKGVVKVKNSKHDNINEGEIVDKKKQKKLKLPLLRRVHIRPAYLIISALVTFLAIFFLRVALWEHSYFDRMEGSERDVAAIEVNESDPSQDEEIDSTEPTEQQIVEYIVAPDKPRYLTIPYLGIYNRRIVELGLKGQNEMSTPYNIHDVGWFTGSVLPGQKGATVLNAHGGDLGYGVFRTLPKLPVGETFTIEMGDGRKLNYKVVESVRKELGAAANEYMNTIFTPIDPNGNTLTMITCTGDWWDKEQTYSQRLFVRAVLQ